MKKKSNKEEFLDEFEDINGYKMVVLTDRDGRQVPKYVHELVWVTFKGAIPDGYMVRHINGKKDDNRISNLQLVRKEEEQ